MRLRIAANTKPLSALIDVLRQQFSETQIASDNQNNFPTLLWNIRLIESYKKPIILLLP